MRQAAAGGGRTGGKGGGLGGGVAGMTILVLGLASVRQAPGCPNFGGADWGEPKHVVCDNSWGTAQPPAGICGWYAPCSITRPRPPPCPALPPQSPRPRPACKAGTERGINLEAGGSASGSRRSSLDGHTLVMHAAAMAQRDAASAQVGAVGGGWRYCETGPGVCGAAGSRDLRGADSSRAGPTGALLAWPHQLASRRMLRPCQPCSTPLHRRRSCLNPKP